MISFVNFVLLVPHPSEKGLNVEEFDEKLNETERLLGQPTLGDSTILNYETIKEHQKVAKGISFWDAWKIPGVVAYSFSYFCMKFSSYGLMLWLPMFLKKMNNYSDYETASAAAVLDIGYVLGGVAIGYLTDLTYSRRSPIAVASILIATVLHVLLIAANPTYVAFFSIHIFLLGALMGGAIAIVSCISCADLVNKIFWNSFLGQIQRIDE